MVHLFFFSLLSLHVHTTPNTDLAWYAHGDRQICVQSFQRKEHTVAYQLNKGCFVHVRYIVTILLFFLSFELRDSTRTYAVVFR